MSDSHTSKPAREEQADWRPGDRLKHLRKEANIALDEIAGETLITLSRLQALEDDDYDRVGEPVFIIAYIRKYARSLSVSSDPFVEQYKLVSGVQEPSQREDPTEAEGVSSGLAAPSVFSKIRVWQVVAVVVLGWLLTVILFDHDTDEPVVETAAPVEQSAPADGPNSDAGQRPGDVTAAQTQAQAEATAPARDLEDSLAVEAPEQEPLESAALESAAEMPAPQEEQGDILLMSFADKCWVKVWDANGEVIFEQMQDSGDNLRLSGEAPYSVMLGNAGATDLLINGRRISTEPPPGKRTLRLNVGP